MYKQNRSRIAKALRFVLLGGVQRRCTKPWRLRQRRRLLAAPDAIFWMIIGGILLHGICYDFFFVTGQIYVDKKSTAAIRGQAQGFFVFITYGVGMLIGAQVAGNVYNRFLTGAPSLSLEQWQSFWWLPAIFAAVVMVFFALTFRDRRVEAAESQPPGDVGPIPVPAEPGV
jgi:MFS family permease